MGCSSSIIKVEENHQPNNNLNLNNNIINNSILKNVNSSNKIENNKFKEINQTKNELNYLLSKYNIDKNKYIISVQVPNIYYSNNVVNINENLICPICYNILNNPISCSLNKTSHSFCQECIDKFLENNNKCPLCKKDFEYKIRGEVVELLKNLNFKCIYLKDGCQKIVKYYDYFKHINNCKYKKTIYECQVEKLDALFSNYKKCRYQGNIKEVENHFKLCAFYEYKCIFCENYITRINLKDHFEKICKIRFIINSNGDIFKGEFKNGKKKWLWNNGILKWRYI